MNIIFFDVDGEKNLKEQEDYCQESKINYEAWPFNERTMYMLRALLNETNSYIVLSSLLRTKEEYRKNFLEKLKNYELNHKMIGCTKKFNNNREIEILNFLKKQQEQQDDIKFIIISDDINRFDKLKKYVVEIDDYHNLLEEQLKKAIDLFKMQEEGKI